MNITLGRTRIRDDSQPNSNGLQLLTTAKKKIRGLIENLCQNNLALVVTSLMSPFSLFDSLHYKEKEEIHIDRIIISRRLENVGIEWKDRLLLSGM